MWDEPVPDGRHEGVRQLPGDGEAVAQTAGVYGARVCCGPQGPVGPDARGSADAGSADAARP
eukprot:4513003-Prymnesium_polylepis.1